MPHQQRANRNAEGTAFEENHHNMQHFQALMEKHDPSMVECCVPTGCPLNEPIRLNEPLTDVVKVICNNEQCQGNTYMHRSCFDQWEESVLTYLRSAGRARSWSEKQRLQNLWTKKGYDLAYKACGCKCQKGHLRKDLNWTPPSVQSEDVPKKKRQRRKKNDKPTLSLAGTTLVPQPPAQPKAVPQQRIRSSSISSTGSGSPPSSSSADCPLSPTNPNVKKFFGTERRERNASGNSLFTRRQDFSSFNSLPKHKINSYHIKMEDEGTQGNDETRCFILSALSAKKVNRIACIFCQESMLIFDRYPLIDGTFFLSPRQHNRTCVPLKGDMGVQYLNAICMQCLEGWTTLVRCRYCRSRWNGSALILGTMYSYDVLAATPCCKERLRCSACHKLIIKPDQRLQFFSDYSHRIPCPYCSVVDYHFVKPLSTYRKDRE